MKIYYRIMQHLSAATALACIAVAIHQHNSGYVWLYVMLALLNACTSLIAAWGAEQC